MKQKNPKSELTACYKRISLSYKKDLVSDRQSCIDFIASLCLDRIDWSDDNKKAYDPSRILNNIAKFRAKMRKDKLCLPEFEGSMKKFENRYHEVYKGFALAKKIMDDATKYNMLDIIKPLHLISQITNSDKAMQARTILSRAKLVLPFK